MKSATDSTNVIDLTVSSHMELHPAGTQSALRDARVALDMVHRFFATGRDNSSAVCTLFVQVGDALKAIDALSREG